MLGSSESWGPQQHPHPWHFRAGGGAVHSIKSRHSQCGRQCFIRSTSRHQCHSPNGSYGISRGIAYLGLRLAATITLPHFSVSSAMSLPKSAGEPIITVPPRSASRALSLESTRLALIASLSLSIISAGVFLGTPMPCHEVAS